jgi:uncharacterized membrane protein YqiK
MNQENNHFVNALHNGLDLIDDRIGSAQSKSGFATQETQSIAQRKPDEAKTKRQKIEEANAKLDAQVSAKIAEAKAKLETWRMNRKISQY